MGNMHIVTGYKGENHVTAADVGSFNAAIFGAGQYVLNRGNKFSTTIVSNNQIRVADGDILMQGRHIRLNEGTYVDLTIDNGAQGYMRNDLIVARYTKDAASGVEDVNLVVIKGTPVEASPADPEYTTGDIINDHVYLADMPLYRVPIDGLNVQDLVCLYEEASIVPSPSDIGAISGRKATASLPVANWSSKTQTVSVPGVTQTNDILVSANPSCAEAYGKAGVIASAQSNGSVTFACTSVPTVALTANIMILEGVAQ